jgi:hypothetical protein
MLKEKQISEPDNFLETPCSSTIARSSSDVSLASLSFCPVAISSHECGVDDVAVSND